MRELTICVKRNEFGNFANATLGTDALNAIAALPGVLEFGLLSEVDGLATVSFKYNGPEVDLESHLFHYKLRLAENRT
jgi:hypothetical protein